MKLDIDAIERRAREASTPDEWQWRRDQLTGDACLEGKRDGQIVLYADQQNGLTIATGDQRHIAAASPPVVLALVAIARAAATYVEKHALYMPDDKLFDDIAAALEAAGL